MDEFYFIKIKMMCHAFARRRKMCHRMDEFYLIKIKMMCHRETKHRQNTFLFY